MFTFITQSLIENITKKDSDMSEKLIPHQQVQLGPSESSKLNSELSTLKDEKVLLNQAGLLKSVLKTRKEYVMTCCSFKDSYHIMQLLPSLTQQEFKGFF